MGSIRDLAYALRPPALDDGLVPAIAQQVSAINARGSRPFITLSAPRSLPPLTPAVYRIVIEAVGNAARHSGAEHCDIRLRLSGDQQLEVSDDGSVGAGTPFRPGVGIASMRERTGELGATLTVEPSLTGTRVHTVLP